MSPSVVPSLPEAFGMVVTFHVKENAMDDFDALSAESQAYIDEHEPGTAAYVVHAVEGEPNQRVFYELYADSAAFEKHELNQDEQGFRQRRQALIDNVAVAKLSVLSHTIRVLE